MKKADLYKGKTPYEAFSYTEKGLKQGVSGTGKLFKKGPIDCFHMLRLSNMDLRRLEKMTACQEGIWRSREMLNQRDPEDNGHAKVINEFRMEIMGLRLEFYNRLWKFKRRLKNPWELEFYVYENNPCSGTPPVDYVFSSGDHGYIYRVSKVPDGWKVFCEHEEFQEGPKSGGWVSCEEDACR